MSVSNTPVPRREFDEINEARHDALDEVARLEVTVARLLSQVDAAQARLECERQDHAQTAATLTQERDAARAERDEAQGELGVCGGGLDMLSGCGEQFHRIAHVFRCVSCGVAFHKHCAQKHFERDSGPTLERDVADLQSRSALIEKACETLAVERDTALAGLVRVMRALEGTPEAVDAVARILFAACTVDGKVDEETVPGWYDDARAVLAALRERVSLADSGDGERGGGA